jgi:hypothetical protein
MVPPVEAQAPTETPAAARSGRRTYVVDRAFQVRYTVMLAVTGGVISCVFGALMFAAHVEARRSLGSYGTLVPSTWLKGQLSQQETTMLWLVVGVTLMMAAALGLFGILVTHRVAGPIFIMTRYVSVLAQGRFPQMRPLRKHDELKDFFDRFQGAVDVLKGREAEEAAKLDDVLKALEPVALTNGASAAIETLKALRDRKLGSLNPPPPPSLPPPPA